MALLCSDPFSGFSAKAVTSAARLCAQAPDELLTSPSRPLLAHTRHAIPQIFKCASPQGLCAHFLSGILSQLLRGSHYDCISISAHHGDVIAAAFAEDVWYPCCAAPLPSDSHPLAPSGACLSLHHAFCPAHLSQSAMRADSQFFHSCITSAQKARPSRQHFIWNE